MVRLAVLLLLSSALSAFGHSGGTNANGCHTNHRTGEYHCHGGRQASPEPTRSFTPSASAPSASFACNGKTVCREMDSCAEAYYYLNTCGLGRLDRDNDGVPCESICR